MCIILVFYMYNLSILYLSYYNSLCITQVFYVYSPSVPHYNSGFLHILANYFEWISPIYYMHRPCIFTNYVKHVPATDTFKKCLKYLI